MTHPLLTAFPIVIEFDVGWSDMDSFEHVSNLEYIRFFQDARIDYCVHVGWMTAKRELDMGPIVKSASATFRKPVKYPDHVWVGVRAIEIQSDRVTFEHKLVSRTLDAVACEGIAVIVNYDYRNERKAPLPEAVRRAIEELERSVNTHAG
jgi:acyl-CoA thioester hydrolase